MINGITTLKKIAILNKPQSKFKPDEEPVNDLLYIENYNKRFFGNLFYFI